MVTIKSDDFLVYAVAVIGISAVGIFLYLGGLEEVAAIIKHSIPDLRNINAEGERKYTKISAVFECFCVNLNDSGWEKDSFEGRALKESLFSDASQGL